MPRSSSGRYVDRSLYEFRPDVCVRLASEAAVEIFETIERVMAPAV